MQNLALGENFAVWPGVFHFTHLRNAGMSFSMFEGGRWVFVIITFAVIAFCLLAMAKKWIDHPFGLISLSCVLGGAVGNLIDRIRWGYVVDMIEVEFIRFPVFNVADCFITCGCVLLIAHLVLFNKAFWKDGKK